MKMKVVNPFVLNNKIFISGSIVEESLFVGQESICTNFLKTGFLVPVEVKATEVKLNPVEEPKAVKIPQAVEVKNQEELKKVVEGPQPSEVKPVEVPKIEEKPANIPIQPHTSTRGRVKRS